MTWEQHGLYVVLFVCTAVGAIGGVVIGMKVNDWIHDRRRRQQKPKKQTYLSIHMEDLNK